MSTDPARAVPVPHRVLPVSRIQFRLRLRNRRRVTGRLRRSQPSHIERQLAREQFVEHHAQRIDVRENSHLLAANLLRRRVCRRHQTQRRDRLIRSTERLHLLRNTKVQQPH